MENGEDGLWKEYLGAGMGRRLSIDRHHKVIDEGNYRFWNAATCRLRM